jgi:hypothetical protein
MGLRAPLRRGALAVDDAAAGHHPVDVAGGDRLHGAERVAMQDLAIEQPGDGGQADVRMRPHVQPRTYRKIMRPEVIDKDERADAAHRRLRHGAQHGEAVAEIGDMTGMQGGYRFHGQAA